MTYALIGWFGSAAVGRSDVRILRYGTRFGLLIGAFFALMMLIEYLVPHDVNQNVLLAKMIFGTFFLLLSVAGLVGSFTTGRLWYGVLTAVWSALIGSLIWFILLLTFYYTFLDTSYEAQFLEVDQTIADFQRSGMQDLPHSSSRITWAVGSSTACSGPSWLFPSAQGEGSSQRPCPSSDGFSDACDDT